MIEPDPLQVAEEAGFDLSLLESTLALTPEQRIEEHHRALVLAWELESAGKALREEPQ
jgi:hypothetical protein